MIHRWGLLFFFSQLLAVTLFGTPASGADWPVWRGLKGDGSTEETSFPTTWSPTENLRWKALIPGVGYSSPIVSQGKIFLTSCWEEEGGKGDPKKRVLYCLDRSNGKILWERVLLVSPLEKKHKLNSFASSTPAADGERVFVTFFDQPTVRVYCYDYSGNKLWEKSPGEFHSVHGFCSPPVLFQDLVIVNCDQDAKGALRAYLVAYDRKTGEERWRIDRPNRIRSYCPPVFGEVNGQTQMVLTGAKNVASYDPKTGKQLWIVDGPTEQFVSSLVFHAGLVFLTAGYPERWVMAIDPTGSGNVTKSHIRWSKINDGGYVPSPVAHGGHFFLVTDEGLASCWEAKSGKRIWQERLGRHHSGSGVIAGGNVYFTDDDGATFVVKASPEYELIARSPIGEKCFTSPAFSDGEIFLRGEKHLFCISAKK